MFSPQDKNKPVEAVVSGTTTVHAEIINREKKSGAWPIRPLAEVPHRPIDVDGTKILASTYVRILLDKHQVSCKRLREYI
jgi:hypothetical protein